MHATGCARPPSRASSIEPRGAGGRGRACAPASENYWATSPAEITSGQITTVIGRIDEMLQVDPSDTRHLFWEEMKRLFFAMTDTEAEDLDDEVMGEFLQAMDGVSSVLYRIERRRKERHKQATDSV